MAIEWDRDSCPECGEEAEQYRKARHCGHCVLTWDGAYVGRDPDEPLAIPSDQMFKFTVRSFDFPREEEPS